MDRDKSLAKEYLSKLDNIQVSEGLSQKTLEACRNSKHKKAVYIKPLAIACLAALLIIVTNHNFIREKVNTQKDKIVSHKDKSSVVSTKTNEDKGKYPKKIAANIEKQKVNIDKQKGTNIKNQNKYTDSTNIKKEDRKGEISNTKKEDIGSIDTIICDKSNCKVVVSKGEVIKDEESNVVPICVEYTGDEDIRIQVSKGNDKGKYEVKENLKKEMNVKRCKEEKTSYWIYSSSKKVPIKGNLYVNVYKEKDLTEKYIFSIEENKGEILIRKIK